MNFCLSWKNREKLNHKLTPELENEVISRNKLYFSFFSINTAYDRPYLGNFIFLDYNAFQLVS